MTVSSLYAPVQYQGNGTTTNFTFSYNFFAPSDLAVSIYDSSTGVTTAGVLNGTGATGYSVNGTQDPLTGEYLSGGFVNFVQAPTGTQTITILRATPATQPNSFNNNAPFAAKSLEASVDRAALVAQQTAQLAARSIQAPLTDPPLNLVMPPVAQRANQLLGCDSQGNVIAAQPASALVSTPMQPVVDAVSTEAALGLMSYLANGGGAVARAVSSKLGDVISLLDFIGTPVNGTNYTTALQDAMAALPGGGEVLIPPGSYLYTPGLVVPAGVVLRGARSYASVLLAAGAPTGTCITLGVSSGLRGLQLTSQAQATAGALVELVNNGAFVEECYLLNYYIGVLIQGSSGGAPTVGNTVRRCSFNGVAGANAAVAAEYTSNLMLEDLVITGPQLPAAQPAASVTLRRQDTTFLRNINATLHGTMKVFPQSGEGNYGLRITDCFFDSANTGDACQFIPGNGGGIYDALIENTWFGLSNGNGLNVTDVTGTGGAVIDGLQISHCEFVSNSGGDGLVIANPGARNIVVTGGLAAGNSASGVYLAAGCTELTLIGVRAGNAASRGANGGYGISTSGAVNQYIITGCNTQGNTAGGLADTASGSTKYVAGNI